METDWAGRQEVKALEKGWRLDMSSKRLRSLWVMRQTAQLKRKLLEIMLGNKV